MAGDAHQAAHSLEDRIVARSRRVGTGLAEARDRAVDDAGIDPPNRLVVEPVALEIADLMVSMNTSASWQAGE